MQDRYVFPALFCYDLPGQVGIVFPDLPGCTSQSDNDIEALKDAREALSLHLYSMERDGDEIPEPTPVQDLRPEPDEAVVLIDVHMPFFREHMDNKSVNRTVTLPNWLNREAKAADLNFSQILQDALIERLGVCRIVEQKNKVPA